MNTRHFPFDDLAEAANESAGQLMASARVLEYKRGASVAFPAHTTMGLLDEPQVVPVPGAPYYCAGLVAWEGRQLPLLDLNALLRAYPDKAAGKIAHVLVLAYQSGPAQPLHYGAVCAPSLLRMVQVSDDQQCALPDDSDLWSLIANSCFLHEGRPVPIIQTARLFERTHL